jgi:hypothetical protein
MYNVMPWLIFLVIKQPILYLIIIPPQNVKAHFILSCTLNIVFQHIWFYIFIIT